MEFSFPLKLRQTGTHDPQFIGFPVVYSKPWSNQEKRKHQDNNLMIVENTLYRSDMLVLLHFNKMLPFLDTAVLDHDTHAHVYGDVKPPLHVDHMVQLRSGHGYTITFIALCGAHHIY